jgi:hypothetical protein
MIGLKQRKSTKRQIFNSLLLYGMYLFVFTTWNILNMTSISGGLVICALYIVGALFEVYGLFTFVRWHTPEYWAETEKER